MACNPVGIVVAVVAFESSSNLAGCWILSQNIQEFKASTVNANFLES